MTNISILSLMAGLRSSSQANLQRGIELLVQLAPRWTPDETHYVRDAIELCPVSVIQAMLPFLNHLTSYQRRRILSSACRHGDIAKIDAIINHWRICPSGDETEDGCLLDNSIYSGRLLTVKYMTRWLSACSISDDFRVSMMLSAIMSGHLHVCRYLQQYLPPLSREDATDIIEDLMFQNNVVIAKYLMTFVPLELLDMPRLLKSALTYSCNEVLNLLLERYGHIANGELTYNLLLHIKRIFHQRKHYSYYDRATGKRANARYQQIVSFLDRPMRKTIPFKVCMGITKHKRSCLRRVTKSSYCHLHKRQRL